ncbi:DNA-binding transcriptional activator of copper-responsive regulon genes (modular protein) (plasmid) [Beijerinckiaceae bacterium RH AL1]|nr:Cu(I)-responsive transcriptional regulator [Beijerinckiaceae bacterium]VVC57314.1 DNA-binding transcriptional activator of copper-responsive regulon genes (modular protein) [Beijerinckiaceae bacterium RH AL1]
MNIGDASRASGLSVKTIRYYERSGLLGTAMRGDSGYRTYSDEDINMMRFLARARRLGFSISQMRELLSLWQDRARESSAVKRLAFEHVRAMEKTVAGLSKIIASLKALAEACDGDERPNCPIINELASGNVVLSGAADSAVLLKPPVLGDKNKDVQRSSPGLGEDLRR